MNEDNLTDLLERVKAAKGADAALDAMIQNRLVGWQSNRATPTPWIVGDAGLPPYTASIDAALALVERLLPGWYWRAGHVPHQRWDGQKYRENWAHLSRTDASNCDRGDEATGWADTVPLAILAALLAALKGHSPHD